MIQKHCFECGTALIEKELEEEGIVLYCPKSVPTALQRNF
jgi:NAD+ diphosphatase